MTPVTTLFFFLPGAVNKVVTQLFDMRKVWVMRRFITIAALMALGLATTLAAHGPDGERAPPTPSGSARRAAVVHAEYRHDDLLWENDRTAHRIYGRALEAVEPPSGSGIDAWAKAVRRPFMDRQLRRGDQHVNHGEGLDFYDVQGSRGAGGLGVWHDHKLWTSRNYVQHQIIADGPDTADFVVDYAPWPVDVDRKVWERRRFTLHAGTNFTRMVSTIGSNRAGPLTLGIGIAKRASGGRRGTYAANRATGRVTWWGPSDPVKGTMAVALMVNPASLVGLAEDHDNHLVLLRVAPGRPFVYYMGAAWDRGLDFRTRTEWLRYVDAQKPSFDPPD